VLPSAAPREVRARGGTPLAEYAALLELVDAVQTLERADIGTIPTAALVDPRDELVSAAGVRAWARRNDLGPWRVEELTGRSPEGRTYRHLIVSEQALGQAAWAQVTGVVRSSFGPPG
jgi:hypothetical protein